MNSEAKALRVGNSVDILRRMSAGRADLAYVDLRQENWREIEKSLSTAARQLSLFDSESRPQIAVITEYLRDLLSIVRPRLSSQGNLFIHTEISLSHVVRLEVERTFGGDDRFVGEVTFAPRHASQRTEALLIFACGSSPLFEQFRTQAGARGYPRSYRHVEKHTGRRYCLTDCVHPKPTAEMYYEWNGNTRAWRWPREKMEEHDRSGRLAYTRSGLPRLKRYLDESRDHSNSDWTGLQTAHSSRLFLMRRIIEIGCRPSSLVLLPVCTDAAAVVASEQLARRWIAVSPTHRTAALVRNELRRAFSNGGAYDIADGPRSGHEILELAKRSPEDFEYWVLGTLGAEFSGITRSSAVGADGWLRLSPDSIPLLVVVHHREVGMRDVQNAKLLLRDRKRTAALIVAPRISASVPAGERSSVLLMDATRLLNTDWRRWLMLLTATNQQRRVVKAVRIHKDQTKTA